MSNVKRLVYSIIQFLGDQLHSGTLSADAAESLEVAIQCLEQAYSINHDDVTSLANLQATQPLLEIFNAAAQAQQQFGAAKEISPEKKMEAERLKNQGNELMKAENHSEALECYSKAIKLDSNNAIYYCNRAAAYSKMGNHQLAIADCEKAIQIDNNYSKAYGRKGLAHANLGQHGEARKCYERAMQLDPDNESYFNNLRVAEEKLRETNLGSQGASATPGAGSFGLDSAGFNFSLFNNPTLMNMATQMMSDPNMQQFLGNLLSGNVQSSNSNNPPGVQDLLQAGQQLAAHMEASNPELVEQLRRQMQTGNSRNPDQSNPDNSSK